MERSEPSFIPGWLKGAAGGGLAPHHYQDGGGFSRNKVTQQLLAVGNHLDSPRGSASSDRVFSPSFRRGHSNSSLERPAPEKDHLSTVHTHTGLNWSSSIHSHDISNWERDGYSVWSDREYEREGDRDFQPRKKEWLLGVASDEREKEREHAENGMLWLSTAGLSGQNDTAMKLRRSQSMGLSPRLSDNGLHKLTEVVSMVPSASGGLATSLQKSVFERNFPSLCADDKHNTLLLSSGSASIASPRPSIASPRHLGRASSPGLPGGFANPISTVSASINACAGGVDVWSSALAEAPTSNGIVQGNSLAAVNVAPITSSSQTSASPGHGPSTTVMPLNMAEALTQNPPRVRTPPQLSLESQRLEELALRQSRQLIPMTPSLPKTMSLVDKAKSKTPRTVDGAITTSKLNQLSGSLQLNSSHKPITPSRSDTLKHSQGKLLVLKSSKDGVTISTTSKSDGTNVGQDTPQGNIGFTAASATNVPGMSVSATGVRGQRKQPHDRRTPSLLGAAVPDGLRAKDPTLLVDDRRPSLQAQNRSDFFNALRKKAARNGSDANTSVSSCQTKGDSLSPREAEMANEVPKSNDSEVKENGISEDSHSTQSSLEIHSNGAVTHSSGNGLIVDSRVKDFSVESQEGSLHSFLPGDSEEEEAAFMRSLGWEENAEGSELTEEEINAFHQSLQMRERKQILNSGGNYNFRALGVDHFVGSVGSMSSGFSSSDLKIDEAPSSLLGRALSNKAH